MDGNRRRATTGIHRVDVLRFSLLIGSAFLGTLAYAQFERRIHWVFNISGAILAFAASLNGWIYLLQRIASRFVHPPSLTTSIDLAISTVTGRVVADDLAIAALWYIACLSFRQVYRHLNARRITAALTVKEIHE